MPGTPVSSMAEKVTKPTFPHSKYSLQILPMHIYNNIRPVTIFLFPGTLLHCINLTDKFVLISVYLIPEDALQSMGDAHASLQISVDPGLDIYMFINLSLKNRRMFDFISSDKLYLLCIVFLHYPQYKYSDINANAFIYTSFRTWSFKF